MLSPLSQPFATAFLTVCFDSGLSKEAAAELLQKETVDQECALRPAFAAGYAKAASEVPGQLLPLRAGYEGMEKLAFLQGLGRAGKALFVEAPKGIAQAIGGVGKGVTTGVSKARSSPFLHRRPFESMLLGSGVAGGTALGVNHLINRDRGLSPSAVDPFFAPGGYSPQAYEDQYKDTLYNQYAPGIFEHNKKHFGSEGRRKELQKAIDNGQGDASAYRELQELNRGFKSSTKARKGHLDGLDNSQAQNRELMTRIADRQQRLEAQRTAWWAGPKRAWLNMTGQNPQTYFDNEIAGLQDSAAQAKRQADLAEDRQRLLWAGATSRQATQQPTTQDIQNRFFPQVTTP